MMFYNKMGLLRWIEISRKYKPDTSCPDYLVVSKEDKKELLGWCLTKAQRRKPESGFYFKRGHWYYPMSLICEVLKDRKKY